VVRIIPVLDVMNGVVVRAIAGRRTAYQPVKSQLTDSTDPLTVANVLLDAARTNELYVADLDAIAGRPASTNWLADLTRRESLVWLDSGIRTYADIASFPDSTNIVPVCSFETVRDISLFHQIKDHKLRDRVAVSLEWAGGRVLGNLEHPAPDSDRWWRLIEDAMHAGCDDVILLDLDTVGTRCGPTTSKYCREVKHTWPHLRVMTGGGVRDWDDVRRLEDAGADGVLVASALHDGTLYRRK
jgi:phosphoribosylformimino-5-aminoimidazole carboxamide ribotide isomerase